MKEKIRRGQLIAPFGVGAISVMRGGVSVVVAGLDHWFKRDNPDFPEQDVNRDEFRVYEPRLEKHLGVEGLYLSPDHRKPEPGDRVNKRLTVPALRFPTWHICSFCGAMEKMPLTAKGRLDCSVKCKGKRQRLVQARFIAMCRHGHLQDFPWREWAHRQTSPTCNEQLYFRGSGGASLAALRVECECGASRPLAGIMDIDNETGDTTLTSKLAPGEKYECTGRRPWVDDDEGSGCGLPLVGTLPNATNVHFARITSAIFLPAEARDNSPADLMDLLEQPAYQSTVNTFVGLIGSLKTPSDFEKLANALKQHFGHAFGAYSNLHLVSALQRLHGKDASGEVADGQGEDLKVEEYRLLQQKQDREEFRVQPLDIGTYGQLLEAMPMSHYFERVSLVEKLRETRTLAGFTRLRPESGQKSAELRALLRRNDGSTTDTWLPAYVVYGEGIFIQFREERLASWEAEFEAGTPGRSKWLKEKVDALQQRGWLGEVTRGSRFLLLHTFAHLLMNRLTFDCGYSSAALRERLYVSADPAFPMAGVLIYTAAGDSEGTLGGLVRMGRPGRLESVIRRALEGARWCSTDPVCMETAERGGQGPDSCNLAACHNCALVPETSCEEFNRFLDRGSVVGPLEKPDLGFFGP